MLIQEEFYDTSVMRFDDPPTSGDHNIQDWEPVCVWLGMRLLV